ncbi:hypothetical protein LPJ66_007352 [Kickxella alabastrina]|uniref:Uncharacterized protein n=1 Tax=Kickxella alabastrina TaxID=61397 RepID=A0ACC1ICV2_9FUNG|nr:hypothetical protein LPJ66_007352 [Kickxella alabastrina]
MDRPSSDQHARIRDAVSMALATKPLAAAQDTFIKFPSATDDTSDQLQSTMRRFRSLSVNTRERAAWSEDTVKRKYPMDKTVELYQFSSVFETADLNQILEPYQHHRCERGGYRLKWLDEARALAVFRRAETAQRVIEDLSASQLVKVKNYAFSISDLADFNKKYGEQPPSPPTAISTATTAAPSQTSSPHPGFDVDHIRYKYRPEVTIELHDFPCPLETADLQGLFAGYKRDNNICRIRWFNRNRALAWFTNSQVAAEALNDLKTCELVHVKPYIFESADIKYFNPDYKMSDIASGGTLARRRTIGAGSSNSGVARRNTVSGASHYNRGQMFAATAMYGAMPAIPSMLGVMTPSTTISQASSAVASVDVSPMPLARRLRRFTKGDN